MTSTTGFLDREIAIDGARRRWVLHLPLGHASDRAWPAILFLHGRGECGSDGRRHLTQGLAPAMLDRPEAWPFVVVFPQKPEDTSAWADELPMLTAILHEVDRSVRIDPLRCHLTGLSQGGHGTIALAARLPWRFATLTPVCGASHDPAAAAAEIGATPLWAFHGDDDPVVPVARSIELVEAIARRGGNARLTRYPGVGHGSWVPAYREPELPRWMLAQHTQP